MTVLCATRPHAHQDAVFAVTIKAPPPPQKGFAVEGCGFGCPKSCYAHGAACESSAGHVPQGLIQKWCANHFSMVTSSVYVPVLQEGEAWGGGGA